MHWGRYRFHLNAAGTGSGKQLLECVNLIAVDGRWKSNHFPMYC